MEPVSGAEDPLGFAQTVLGQPAILLDSLNSAPPTPENLIEWTDSVPTGLLDSYLEWTATARIVDDRLIDLRLESAEATITLPPQ